MPTDLNSLRPDTTADLAVTRSTLLTELEAFEHLLFEPVTQRDLDGLYALYARWQAELGDSPASIALCDALEDLIDACIESPGPADHHIEQAFMDLVARAHAPAHQGT
jgi:hypothetical protein